MILKKNFSTVNGYTVSSKTVKAQYLVFEVYHITYLVRGFCFCFFQIKTDRNINMLSICKTSWSKEVLFRCLLKEHTDNQQKVRCRLSTIYSL